MKIGVLAGGSIPSYFAHSFNVMKMAKGFMELGHEVEVVTADSVKSKWLRHKIKNIHYHYGVPKKMRLTWLPPSLTAYLTNRTSGDGIYCRRAAEYAFSRSFDFVFCRNYRIPCLTARMGIPTAIETHTVNYDHPDLQKVFQVGKLASFKGLVTIHEKIGKEHIKRGIPPEKIHVLEDGVDMDRFEIKDDPVHWRKQLYLDPEKKYAVYCGQLYPDKGIEVILEAAKSLSKYKDLIFLIVGGGGSNKKHWEKYCRIRKIHNVVFTGFVENSLVPAYLKSADCLLLPYKMDMDHKVMDINTTSPLKLFEYMAAKRVIIATEIPTILKILNHGQNALLAKPSVSDFADMVLKGLEGDSEMKNAIGRAAYDDVLGMSWRNRCSKILSAI